MPNVNMKEKGLSLLIPSIKKGIYVCMACILSLSAACDKQSYTPKPVGYYRIALPQHQYRSFDTLFPYQFEFSTLACRRPAAHPEPYWINIEYPSFNAQVFISYKKVINNVDTLINDSKTFVTNQIQKADDIIEYHVYDSLNKVYGISYDILGSDVACPYQFWLTDNEKHFFRASLYFNHSPNNDSVAPVIEYIRKDMLHLIETFAWK